MKNITWILNWLKVSIFAAFGVVFGASSVWGQSSGPSLLIGPVIGYAGVAYNTNEFPVLASEPYFFIDENGNGSATFFGITTEIPLSINMHDFLILEAIYDSKPGNFTSFAHSQGDSIIDLSSSLSYLLVNIGFKYNFFASSAIPSGLGIQACASFGWAVNHTFTTYYDSIAHIESYPGYSVLKSQTSISNIDGYNPIRIAIRTELTYDIPFLSRLILTPSVGYDAPLTKVDNTSRDWWARSLYGAIALRYAFGSF